MSSRGAAMLLALALSASACLSRPTNNPNVVVASITTGPNNLDPRVGTDDTSQKLHDLIFDSLVQLDAQLRIVPKLAERFEHPDPLTYIATLRRGVRFHDGRELTADDVVYTAQCMLDPKFVSAKKGGFRELKSVVARDPYTVVFTLKNPFESFPINLNVLQIVPKGSDATLRQNPIGTGPYRFVRYDVDDRVELAAFGEYYGGRPRNDGLIFRIIPDEVMRGLELKKGTIDVVVNDISPDIVEQLRHDPALQTVETPGVDYQYIGINLREPLLQDVRVRQALAHAIDRQAIVDYLRRGLADASIGMLPPVSWAFAADVQEFPFDPVRARTLLDAAGYPDPDGDGPAVRFNLTLEVSNIEFNRLQSTVIQQNWRDVGVGLDIRTYEFATLYADILAGRFQLFTLQWTGGALADPDILRRVFHSDQVPPTGFNRGYFNDAEADQLLDRATNAADPAERLAFYRAAQRRIAEQVPYISLWYKTNVAVASRSLTGIQLSPLADLFFLKDVARLPAPAAN